MDIIRKQGVWRLFDKHTSLIITDEKQLERIIEDPSKPLFEDEERGFSGEKDSLYKKSTSLVDICREGQAHGAERLEVSYDFFFGGTTRTNYPDSEITLKAFKVIRDVARQYGMGFSASILSPLDIGGGYARQYDNTGFSYQYLEGAIDPKTGEYAVDMVLQRQWYNNKGPIQLKLEKVLVFAFREEKIQDTCYFYVNPDEILDITSTVSYEADEASIQITRAGYGYGKLRVWGKWDNPTADRCLAVAVYRTPELDYFADNALPYIKGLIDTHKEAGIDYQGFYSDEMHIQFDWDLGNHFGETEINTRYLTDPLAAEYAKRYGAQYRDFARYLVYFSYHQHDFIEGPEGKTASQHVFGKDEKSIYETWLFRKRYFEMLQTQVVGLSIAAKDYAESLFGAPIMTRAHATWQESPTCDHFYKDRSLKGKLPEGISMYEYTPHYVWSASIRENTSACYDYFKWNDFLSGAGNDHPEGGNTDRNYYAQALACSFGSLNKFELAYCACWGSPKEVIRRFGNVGAAYGNPEWQIKHGYNFVQGIGHRLTDVLALYPLELNYVEERFGSWMTQYGYCNYITEEKLLENATLTADGKIRVKGRDYKALLVFFEPFISQKTLDLLKEFVHHGGKLIWTSIYPVLSEENTPILDQWKELFGIESFHPAFQGVSLQDQTIHFESLLQDVSPMTVLTDLLPDLAYPVLPAQNGEVVARCGSKVLGVARKYDHGGIALYAGFRPRDDQSCSLGQDADTLFRILMAAGAYEKDGAEALSRPTESRYLINTFSNGAVSITNHYRTFYEAWGGSFFRDEKADAQALQGRDLPPVDIALDHFSFAGHNISYNGTDVLTYQVGEDGRLYGFAGNETTGITIDGRSYQFSDHPVNMVWTVMPKRHVPEEIKELYLLRVEEEATVTLPVPFTSEEGLRVEVCEDTVFKTDRTLPFTSTEEGLLLNITAGEAGKWIAIIG